MDNKLAEYVRTAMRQGFSHRQVVAERLRSEGWPAGDIQAALAGSSLRHRRSTLLWVALAGFVAFLILGILAYLFIIAPAFVEKPELQRPAVLAGTQRIDESHIAYVLTELGAYKLHANPFTSDLPEMEIYLTDVRQVYAAIVENNVVRVRKGTAQSPDVRVELTQDAIVLLATAADKGEFDQRTTQLLEEIDQRGYTAELQADEKDLVLKGYLVLYGEHQEKVETAGITGGAIAELPLLSSGLSGIFVIIIMLWYAVLVHMALNS